jgi:hypothetical protein
MSLIGRPQMNANFEPARALNGMSPATMHKVSASPGVAPAGRAPILEVSRSDVAIEKTGTFTYGGFRSVSNTHRMVGRNTALGGFGFVMKILIPAAFPNILAGLKIGWAFAWRTLIAAELVFGTTSGRGGLGWYIFKTKNNLSIPQVVAGLLSIILIGLFVENVIFSFIEYQYTALGRRS